MGSRPLASLLAFFLAAGPAAAATPQDSGDPVPVGSASATSAAPVAGDAAAEGSATAPDALDLDAMVRARDGKPPERLDEAVPAVAAEASAPAKAAGNDVPVTPPGTSGEAVEVGVAGDSETAGAAAPAAPAGAPQAPEAAAASAAGPGTPAQDATGNPAPDESGAATDWPRIDGAAAAPADDEAAAAQKRLQAACTRRATALLDAAQKHDYDTATRDFDARMRGALPPAQLRKAWESLGQFGTLKARGQSHVATAEGYIAVTIPLLFDKANLYAQVACGSDGRIAGFYVKPLPVPAK